MREKRAESLAGFAQIGVGVQINLLVFDGAPQPLNEDIVEAAAFAIHADFYAVLFEHVGKGQRRELCALVAVENLGLAVTRYGFFDGSNTEIHFHRVG